MILLYGAGLVLLFLLLFLHQRRALSRFAGSRLRKWTTCGSCWRGSFQSKAVLPSQPALNNIAYLADRWKGQKRSCAR